MPASMITACVALSPKVTGSRMLIPESGPMPGSTPTSVPTRQPRNAYQRLAGASATPNPCTRLMRVLSIRVEVLEAERAGGHLQLQTVDEADIGDADGDDAVERRVQHVLALDDEQEAHHHRDHGDDEAGLGVEHSRCRGDADHHQRVLAVGPVDVGERPAFLS